MTKLTELKKRWLQDEDVHREYEGQSYEFEVAHELIEARVSAGLTQEEVADKMGTTQSVIARIESASHLPSMKSIVRYAMAVGARPMLKLLSSKNITAKSTY